MTATATFAGADWSTVVEQAESADLFLYDEIVDPYTQRTMGFGISAESFAGELRSLKGKSVNLHISSPGGHVGEGIAIWAIPRVAL